MKLTIRYAYLLTYLPSNGLQEKALRWVRKINSPFTIMLSLILMVHGLAGCSSLHSPPTPDLQISPNTTEQGVKCKVYDATNDWMQALMLGASERKKALSRVTSPNNETQTWLRVFLLTHNAASYHELQEAEQLLLNKLNSNNIDSNKYGSQALHAYILKLNRYFQEKKSEAVLLQRQLNTRDQSIKTLKLVNEVLENKSDAVLLQRQLNTRERSIKTLKLVNEVLESKIEALTNIEQRMRLHPNKIGSELTP